MKGIDVSKWQGNIIWASVKASGIGFAILKCGGSDAGFYTDPKFEQNYKEAKAVGIPVGAYYFVGSKCISYEDGVADALRCLDIINGKTFEYPVFIDLETTRMEDKEGSTQACLGFCKTMEEAGYYSGIYASDIYGFKDRLDLSKLSNIDKWVAIYGSKPSYVKDWMIWQYSSEGKVNGINGNVDLDETDVDYPSIIKSAGLSINKKENSNKNNNSDIEITDVNALVNRLLDLCAKHNELNDEMKEIIAECQMLF